MLPVTAQYSFLANGLSPDPKTQVWAAQTSGDRIIARIADDQHEIETPAAVRQIAVTCDGLWCLTKKGDLYLWRGLGQFSAWKKTSPPQTGGSIVSITCYRDGRLHVSFADDRELLIDDSQQKWSTSGDKAGQQNCNSAPTNPAREPEAELSFLNDSPQPKPKNRKKWFRFSIRTCLLSFVVVAAVLGPINYLLDSFQIRQAVEVLEAQGHTIVFHHEVDAQGQPVKNPQSPSPAWVDRLFGPNLMDRPFRFEQFRTYNKSPAPVDSQRLVQLDSLRELRVSKLDDLSCIQNLSRLEELNLFAVKEEFDLAWLKALPNLKRLELSSALTKGNLPVEHLRQLEELDIAWSSLEDKKTCLPTIAKCKRMKKLTMRIPKYFHQQNEQLFKLTKLESLTISEAAYRNIPRNFLEGLSGFKNLNELKLSALSYDIQWLEKCKNLKSLKSTGYGEIKDFSVLKNLKLLEELSLPVQENYRLEGSILESLPKLSLDRVELARASRTGRSGGNLLQSRETLDYSLTTLSRISPSAIKPSLKYADLNLEISDLSPLRGVALERIRSSCPALTDLSPLAGAPLGYVYLKGTAIENITPLANPNLCNLDISGTRVKKLDALKTLKGLTALHISNTEIEDLSPIKHLKLYSFHAANTPIRDVSALKLSRGLNDLDLSGTEVKDLKGNEFLRLRTLKIADTRIRHLPKLPNPEKLKHLDFSNTLIEDLAEFKNLPALKYLNISGTKITDVSFATGYDLESLIANNTELTGKDLAQIQFGSLNRIFLKGTNIKDLNWLGSPRDFCQLDVSETEVSDLSPLSGLNLGVVNLSGTRVKDLSSLKQMEYLKVLSLPQGTNYSDAMREKNWINLERIEVAGKVVWEKTSEEE